MGLRSVPEDQQGGWLHLGLGFEVAVAGVQTTTPAVGGAALWVLGW